MTDRQRQAKVLEQIASDLEAAAAHCRVASTHLVERQDPRYGAHCWAAQGHIERARTAMSDQAMSFGERARPVIDDEV